MPFLPHHLPFRSRRRRTVLLAVPLLAVLVAGASLASGRSPAQVPTTTASSADRAALVKHLTAHPVGTTLRSYQRLVDTLPNAKAADGSSLTDSLVVGVVAAVANGSGFDESGRPPSASSPSARVVRFDDPDADWRTLKVTLRVDEVLAGPAARQLELDWPVMGNASQGEDATAIARGLKGLGTLAVLSLATPAGPEYLGLRRQVPDRQYGIALVGKDGALSFPFINGTEGAAVDARTYMGGVDTLPELRSAAAKPAWTRSG